MEQQLLVEVSPDWVEYCIDYTHLRQLVEKALENKDNPSSTTAANIVEAFNASLQKCGSFVVSKMGELELEHCRIAESEIALNREATLYGHEAAANSREHTNHSSDSTTSSELELQLLEDTTVDGAADEASHPPIAVVSPSDHKEPDAASPRHPLTEDSGTNVPRHNSSYGGTGRVSQDFRSERSRHLSFVNIRRHHVEVLKLQRFAILNAKVATRIFQAPEGATSAQEAALAQLAEKNQKQLDASDLVAAHFAIEKLAVRFEDLLRTYYAEEFETALRGEDQIDTNKLVNWHVKWHFIILAIAVFGVLVLVPLGDLDEPAHHCAAMIATVSVLWVTEAIPFFCTAMLIPLIAAPLGVLPGKTRTEAGAILLAKTFDHTQILVLGGLCIGKALAKHKLEVAASRLLLRRVAHRPKLYLLVVMLLSCAACAFMSNVAAPLLMLSVIQPTLWELDRRTGAPQAILLALALACNFGGMLSPIASPQNAVALQALGPKMQINFGTWVACAIPLVFIGTVASWAALLFVWKPFKDIKVIPIPLGGHAADLDHRRMNRGYHAEATTKEKVEIGVVIGVSVLTVILWCIPSEEGVGDSGIIALIPIVAFFGMGILTKEDFNSLSWHLMFLLAGGNMLGLCAKESKFLESVVLSMKGFLTSHSSFVVMLVLLVAIAFITTFVSHTVASLILMPVIVEVASINEELPSAAAMVFCSVMMVSGSMAFPVTSFPNVNSLLTEDPEGAPYLVVKNFLGVGFALSMSVLAQLLSYMLPYAEQLLPKR